MWLRYDSQLAALFSYHNFVEQKILLQTWIWLLPHACSCLHDFSNQTPSPQPPWRRVSWQVFYHKKTTSLYNCDLLVFTKMIFVNNLEKEHRVVSEINYLLKYLRSGSCKIFQYAVKKYEHK